MNTQLTTRRPAHEILEIMGFLVPFPSVLIAAIIVLVSSSLARGQSYSYTIVAQTGQNGISSISGAPSINNSGNCAFPAQLSAGPAIFVGNGSVAPVNISPSLAVSSQHIGSFVQINDNNVVVASDMYSGTTPGSYYVRTWTTDGSGSNTIVAKNASGGFVEDASINNNGQVAYLGRNGSSTYTLYTTNTAGPEFYYTANLGNISDNFYFNPMIADNGSIAAKYELGSSTSGSIRAYNSTLQSYVVVAAVGDANQFDSLDRLPGISPNGMVVAFNGSTPQGAGIFECTSDSTGSFASSIPYEVAGPSTGFTSFQSESRVAVNARSVTVGTNSWQAISVAYIGTQNGIQGLYVGSCLSLGPTNTPFVVPPSLVISNGQTIEGLDGTVQSIAIQNPQNTNGMVVCQVTMTSGAGGIVLCSCLGPAPIANIYSPSVQADMGTGEDAWAQTVGGWYYFGSQPENIVLGPFPMPTNSLPGVVAPIGDAGAPASQVFNWAQDPASGATVDLARPDSTSGATVDLATLGEMAVHPLLTMSGARDLDFKIYYDSTITGGNQYIASPSAGGCPYWTLYTPGDVGHWTHNFDGQAAYFPGSGGTSNMVVILLSHRRWTFIQNGSGYQPFDQSSAHDSLGTNPDGSYTLTNMDQSTYTFSVTGSGTNLYLTQVTNPHGQALIVDRNSDNGQINTITEPVSGEYFSFTYGTAGNNFPALIISISDSAGRSVSLSYDGNDMLTNVIEANGNSTSFTYDSNRHLVNEADAMGNLLVTISYNPDGTVASQTDARDNQYLYGYSMNTDANRNVISTVTYVTNRDSYVSIYQFDPNHNLISYTSPDLEQTTNSYDGNGNLLTTTDPLGKTTTYAYDDNGNVVAVTNALNYVTVMTYYDGTHNLWTITDPDDNTSTFTYDNNNNVLTTEDSLGHQVVRTYDGNSLLLTQTSPNGGVATYTYSGGLPASLEDAAGNIESMMYDDVGNLQTFTDAAGNSTVSKYGPLRELMEVDDAAGNKLVNTYDWRLRKSTITDFSGAVTSYGYDGNNNLVAVTNALNQVTTCGYDPENLPSSVTDPLGNKSSLGYDKDARLIETMDAMGDTASCTYDMDDDLASVTDSKGNIVVTNSYDACNELLSSQDALGHTTTCTYDPASVLASAKDPLGHVKSFIHDTLERTVTVDAPLSTTTMQGFDADGNCTSLTNANNNSTTFAFDSADRPMKTTTATGDSTTCSYNSRNLPSVITQPSGASVTYSYDSLGRITNTVDPVGSITYTYDPDGRVLATAETSSNVTKTISRQYDFLGRLKGFTDAASNVLQYAYYADGSLQTLTYPDGKQVNYGYDAARRLNSVTDWTGRVTKFMYDADSRVATITRPDNSSETFSYYANGNISQSIDQTASHNVIHNIQYSYDDDDEITCEDATPAPGIYHPANFSSTVDADNRLATINGQPAVYDNNGNLTSATVPGSAMSVLTYDARNRLISAGGLTYAYDAENRRTSVSSSAGTTTYVINPNAGLSQALVKTAPDGTVTRYVYGLGLIGEETGSTFTTYHYDRRGSTTALTDINGNITQTFSYGPNGEPVGFSPATAPTQFLYGGRYGVQSDTNGLCYMRARYYLPAIGRFIDQDTTLGNIDSGTSLNRFAYGNADPINKIDPLGATPIALFGWLLREQDSLMEASAADSHVRAVFEKIFHAPEDLWLRREVPNPDFVEPLPPGHDTTGPANPDLAQLSEDQNERQVEHYKRQLDAQDKINELASESPEGRLSLSILVTLHNELNYDNEELLQRAENGAELYETAQVVAAFVGARSGGPIIVPEGYEMKTLDDLNEAMAEQRAEAQADISISKELAGRLAPKVSRQVRTSRQGINDTDKSNNARARLILKLYGN